MRELTEDQAGPREKDGVVRRPRLLDLFCGAGGCSVGYHRAGFDVVGVDIEAHPSYPFEFVQADAREVLKDVDFLRTFDALGGSPPCQELTRARHLRDAQGGTVKEHGVNLIPETRAGFLATGLPYVIENVQDAVLHLVSPLMLCGSSFGLKVRRHRLFEASFPMLAPPCMHGMQGRPVGVYGTWDDSVPGGGQTAKTIEEAREAMGIDWMRWRSRTQEWNDLKEAIPPAYTEFIGAALLDHLARERARALEVPKPPPVPDGIDALFDLPPDRGAPDPTERTA
jgi:DNA (cytosine-5)-methyltransferase 1